MKLRTLALLALCLFCTALPALAQGGLVEMTTRRVVGRFPELNPKFPAQRIETKNTATGCPLVRIVEHGRTLTSLEVGSTAVARFSSNPFSGIPTSETSLQAVCIRAGNKEVGIASHTFRFRANPGKNDSTTWVIRNEDFSYYPGQGPLDLPVHAKGDSEVLPMSAEYGGSTTHFALPNATGLFGKVIIDGADPLLKFQKYRSKSGFTRAFSKRPSVPVVEGRATNVLYPGVVGDIRFQEDLPSTRVVEVLFNDPCGRTYGVLEQRVDIQNGQIRAHDDVITLQSLRKWPGTNAVPLPFSDEKRIAEVFAIIKKDPSVCRQEGALAAIVAVMNGGEPGQSQVAEAQPPKTTEPHPGSVGAFENKAAAQEGSVHPGSVGAFENKATANLKTTEQLVAEGIIHPGSVCAYGACKGKKQRR